MSVVSYGFILTILAGLSTMIGTILIFFKRKSDSIIIGSLSFASGVMITVSITDLIPESYASLSTIYRLFPTIMYILIGIVSGLIFSMTLDKYLPDNKITKKDQKGLYRVGVFSMLAIILHNIPEDCVKYVSQEI